MEPKPLMARGFLPPRKPLEIACFGPISRFGKRILTGQAAAYDYQFDHKRQAGRQDVFGGFRKCLIIRKVSVFGFGFCKPAVVGLNPIVGFHLIQKPPKTAI